MKSLLANSTPALIALILVATPNARADSCRDRIRTTTCLVDPADWSNESPDAEEKRDARPCLPGGERYTAVFEEIHDQFPPALQKIFCSVRHIFIEKEFIGSAYGGLKLDRHKKILGAKLGVRQSLLDHRMDLHTWASWKEQLSFGGHARDYQLTPGLPIVRTASPARIHDFIYFLVAHEFAHVLDFMNRVNRSHNCVDPGFSTDQVRCEPAPGSWGAISWLTDLQPKPENDFARRKDFCFYECGDRRIPREEIARTYDALAGTDFISAYATTQPWDDFADSVAYFVMDRELGTRYAVELPSGAIHDPMAKLHSERFRVKREFIQEFLDRKDLKYP